MKKRCGTPMSTQIVLQLLTLLLCAVFIFACGSDDNNNDDNDGDEIEVTLADLVGTYEMTGFSMTFEDETHTDEDVQTWWGDMRIVDDGTLTLNMTINQISIFDDEELTIVDVENDALLVRSADGDEQYVDMNRDGDNITLIFEGSDAEGTYSLVLEFRKTGSAAEDEDSASAEDEDPATADPEPTPGDAALADLVGTYELTDFFWSNGDQTYEDEDLETFFGRVNIRVNGILRLNMVARNTSDFEDFSLEYNNYPLEIVEVESDALLVKFFNDCEEYLDMNRNGDNMTLIFPEGDCMGDVSMMLGMRRIRNTVGSFSYNAMDSGSNFQLGNLKAALEKIADSLEID